jgi:hypothetical protein
MDNNLTPVQPPRPEQTQTVAPQLEAGQKPAVPASDADRISGAPAAPAPDAQGEAANEPRPMTPEEKRMVTLAILLFVILLAAIFGGIFYLANAPLASVAKIRDIFIIFMALMSLLTSATLVILLVQLARLINLLQNEIKPIMESTNETVSYLRGTTLFLSDNLVGPVMKLNEYMAGFSQFTQILGFGRKPPRSKPPKGV